MFLVALMEKVSEKLERRLLFDESLAASLPSVF